MEQSKWENSNLTWKQKFSVVFLLVFAVSVVFLWAMDLKKDLNNSLGYNGEDNSKTGSEEVCLSGNCAEDGRDNIDSDGDGLLDWEEEEIYQTSPYLEDSDGDGYTDKEEIDSGNDPNCPRGEDCYNSENNSPDSEGVLATSSGQTGLETGDLSAQEEAVKSLMEGQATPETLRETLKEAGMNEEVLNNLTDEQLMESYSEVLSQN